MLSLRATARMGVAALAYRCFGVRRPVNVMLAVTNRCNGACRYCRIPARPGGEPTLDQVRTLIDQMQAAGTVRLGLWGGEPLMRDDIGRIVSYAAQRGLYTTMDTNGLLWEERRGELTGLDHLIVSLDGDRAGHEANRGAGTFERVTAALESAAARPGLNVWTLTVLTRHNLGDIDFLLRTAERLKIRCCFQILHHNAQLGRNHDELMPSNEAYRDAIRLLLRRKREGARISSSTRYLRYLLDWDDYRRSTQPAPHRGVRCKAGGLYCNVDTNGKVYACSLLADEAEALSALDVGLREAFDRIPAVPCQACTAACFTEYNYLYGLDPVCIAEWLLAAKRR